MQGGSDGRRFALIIVVATVTTFGLHSAIGLEFAQPWVLVTDLIVLALIVHMAMTSDMHWPMWFCGFHAISVATGVARFSIPSEVPTIYTNFSGFWAIPALAAAVVGVLLDRRADLASSLTDH